MERRFAASLVSTLVLLAGCGFTPVYSSQGSGIGQVEVAEIEGRTGWFARQELQRLSGLEGRSEKRPVLTVRLTNRYQDVAIQTNSFANRTLLEVTAAWSLVDGPTTLTGTVSAQSGFDGRDQAYSGIALQADAEARLGPEVARRVWADIRQKRGATRSASGTTP